MLTSLSCKEINIPKNEFVCITILVLFNFILFAEMSRFSFDNNNFPYDNNVLVLDMVLGSLWGVPQPINWDNVSKLVPGFSAKEVTSCIPEHTDFSLLTTPAA